MFESSDSSIRDKVFMVTNTRLLGPFTEELFIELFNSG